MININYIVIIYYHSKYLYSDNNIIPKKLVYCVMRIACNPNSSPSDERSESCGSPTMNEVNR